MSLSALTNLRFVAILFALAALVLLAMACSGGSDGGGRGGDGAGSNSPEDVGRAVVQAYIDGDSATLQDLVRPDQTVRYVDWDFTACVISEVFAEQIRVARFNVTVRFESPCGIDRFTGASLEVNDLSGRMYWDGQTGLRVRG